MADDVAAIPDRLLIDALEFAVGIAAAGSKLKPPLPFPAELKDYLGKPRLTARHLAAVRRIVAGSTDYRRRLAAAATPELLDELSMVWITRPDGWETQATELVERAVREAEEADLAARLARSERRREGAEQAARRATADALALRAEVDRLTGELARSSRELAAADDRQRSLRAEVDEVRAAEQRAVCSAAALDERIAALTTTADAAIAEATALRREMADIAAVRDRALAMLAERVDDRDPGPLAPPSGEQGGRSSAGGRQGGRQTIRRPIAIPGGLLGSSVAVLEHIVRVPDIVVIVDGYNVAKQAWPTLALDAQRDACIRSAENVATRYGVRIVIVFDGADIVGASASGRRVVRIVYSPAGVSADDVIRAEVAAIPTTVPVAVVTEDRAIAVDVRSVGANVLDVSPWRELGG
jgi:hypothetical protein